MDALPLVEGSVAVFERDGAVLLTRRREGSHLAGYWEFPGGRIEAGETPEACLVREMREELGVEVRVGARLTLLDHAYPEKRVRLHCFCCDIMSGNPRPIAGDAMEWVPRRELPLRRLPPANGPLVEILCAAAGRERPRPKS